MDDREKTLFIRADATPQIGTGHIMRCIALAQAWLDKGGKVIFLSHCDSETLRHRIINEGFDLIPIEKPFPDPSDLTQTLNVLKRHALCSIPHASPWLVLDGYHFTPYYQKAIRENGHKLLVIDDMAHLDHYHADILLNQNIHAPKLNYPCDKDTIQLLGCDYTMLRKEFLKYRNWNRQIPEKAKKILVTMGGSDPDNVTLKVIEAIKSLNMPELDVQVIDGPSNPNLRILKASMLHAPCPMRLLYNASNMPELMAWADLSISAGGSTCWELAFMGVPSLTVVIAENQRDVAKGLERAEIFKTVGWYKAMNNDVLVTRLSSLIRDKKLREKESRLGRQLIDGKGAKNIVQALFERCAMKREMKANEIF
jgi:UDP-2,4-diacetamido-2,4,6-trideoxy-beta-L-altropyranose hydrolase